MLVPLARAVAPLMVKFSLGKGMVFFTSFHAGKSDNDEEKKLLKNLVFATVTARTQMQVERDIARGGFSPQQGSLLSSTKDHPSVTKKYGSKQLGKLQLALGFEDRGATLRLKIKAPNGLTFEKEASKTLIIETPETPAGEWEFTITAVKVPYENFPYTFTIAEKKAP